MKRVALYPFVIVVFCLIFIPQLGVRVISSLIIFIYSLSFIISLLLKNMITVSRDKKIYRCYNGAKEYVTLNIVNRGVFPLDLALIHDAGLGQSVETVSMLSEKKVQFKINTRERGIHKIGPVYVEGSDPFTFFPFKKSLKQYSDIIVYPRFYSPELILENGERGGRQKVNNPIYEDNSSLQAIRAFRPGDSMKNINWKATAKMGELQTMEFSSTISAPLFILIDLALSTFSLKKRHTYAERSIEAAASVISAYSIKGEACGLLSYDKNGEILIPSASGNAHLVSVFEKLSQIDLTESRPESVTTLFLNRQLSLPEGCHLYIFTPAINENLFAEIQVLCKKRLDVKLVNTSGRETDFVIPKSIDYFILTSYGREYFDEK